MRSNLSRKQGTHATKSTKTRQNSPAALTCARGGKNALSV
ncbi:hypothetical protein CAMSH0001_1186 [Campylobacter showae RM3277]|uniref:Uncharacterized protein n=1 Tax=Campylobacter showae RM3277 TaxID=553219 RepID=C6RDM9_9BACT|nr:hypothetical protein CAMSH0001_1186 [Campylobacter showae RM3277]